MTEDQLIPPPANPSAPPQWLADLINKGVQRNLDWAKFPGQVVAGVTPDAPGQWSEADQFRQDSLDRRQQTWAPQAAAGEVFWPRVGRNVGGSGFTVGSGATGGEGNIIPFPKSGGKPSTPKTTADMLRTLFDETPAAAGPTAEIKSFTPALTAKQQVVSQADKTAAERQSLLDLIASHVENKTTPKPIPKDVVSTLGKLDNLGFDRPGQAMAELRADMSLGRDGMMKKWDIGPKDEMAFQKIWNHLKGTEK